MEKVFFVNQKKHNKEQGTWDNNCHTKATQDEAVHQYHAFMSTYANGQVPALDYVACDVVTSDGFVIVPMDIWQAPDVEPETPEEVV